ncbi:hypothetical protein DFH06DRAFT_608242 [Mycena polygramma]|nr:hypothetical protein DFH06DRAFT_608242 [Mycena polygramma]
MTSQSTNVVARRSAIDAELTSLYERIALLKAERNSTAPFFSLPNELLAQIFGVIADPGPHITISVLPALRKLMLVCKWWRDVALSTHSLWSKIATHWRYPAWGFHTQMVRSGNVPVKINARQFDSCTFPTLVFDNSYRLASLHLTATPPHLLDFLQEMRNHKFPLLHSLQLWPECSDKSETEAEMVDASLPAELFDGRMPRLCQLSLTFIAAPWHSLPPLQSLVLIGGMTTTTTPIEWRVLLDILRASRALHTLKLDFILTDGIRECRPVDLPHLEVLHIEDSSERCENLLFSLTFPATTRLELYPWGITTGPEIRDILIPAQKHLRASGAPIPLRLALRTSLRGHSYFRAVTYVDANPNEYGEREVLFEISVHPASAPALRQIITKVLKALPTKTLTTLDATFVRFTVPTWKAALALLPAIENVDIGLDEAGTAFFEAALEACYWLHTITVHALLRGESGDESAPVTGFFDMLTRLLCAQHAIGRRLRQLEVTGLGSVILSDEKWEELRGLVGTLVRPARHVVERIQR